MMYHTTESLLRRLQFLNNKIKWNFKTRINTKKFKTTQNFPYTCTMIFFEKELDIDNKLHNYLKMTGILNNVFRPQKLLRKQE